MELLLGLTAAMPIVLIGAASEVCFRLYDKDFEEIILWTEID
jgi:hypothetical protein